MKQIEVAGVFPQLHQEAQRLATGPPITLDPERPQPQAPVGEEVTWRLRVLEIDLRPLAGAQLAELDAQRLFVERRTAHGELIGLVGDLVADTGRRNVTRVERADRTHFDQCRGRNGTGRVGEAGDDAGSSPLEPARAEKACAREQQRVVRLGHQRHTQVADVLKLRIGNTLAVVGPPERYAKQPKTRAAEFPRIADEIATGAVADADGVAEEALVGVEDAVLVEIFGIL